MSELKNFRQLHSKTPATPKSASPRRGNHHRPAGPGHHQRGGHGAGREAAGAEFNRDGHTVVDHHTYAFLGDGCLMEGISHEACALAGAWKLNKLIALYDDNGISIDGQVAPWFADDTALRFRGLRLERDRPGRRPRRRQGGRRHRRGQETAEQAHADHLQDHIGKGSPNRANTAKAHGEPLGAEEIKLTREAWAGRTSPS
jgi:transketolase